MGECCWPEQDAVWNWMEKHNISLSIDEENELKESVTKYRVSREKEIASLQAQLAERDQRIDRISTQHGVRENDLLRRISEMGAERDRLLEQREATILEQQARINAIRPVGKSTLPAQWVALESALASERLKGKIEGLEELANAFAEGDETDMYAERVLRRSIAELKEGE